MSAPLMADAEHAARPGEPPPVRDEAADTPMWLPIVGLCILVFGTLVVLWQSRSTPEETAEEAAEEAAVEGEAAPAAEGAAAPAAAQPAAAQPAEHDHPH